MKSYIVWMLLACVFAHRSSASFQYEGPSVTRGTQTPHLWKRHSAWHPGSFLARTWNNVNLWNNLFADLMHESWYGRSMLDGDLERLIMDVYDPFMDDNTISLQPHHVIHEDSCYRRCRERKNSAIQDSDSMNNEPSQVSLDSEENHIQQDRQFSRHNLKSNNQKPVHKGHRTGQSFGSRPLNQQPMDHHQSISNNENNDKFVDRRQQFVSNSNEQSTRSRHNDVSSQPIYQDRQRQQQQPRTRERNSVNIKPVTLYSVQVPNYKPSEIQVKNEGRTLRIKGKQACGCQETCSVREFERVTMIPEGIDTRNIYASLHKDGTLSIQYKQINQIKASHIEDRDILVEGIDLPSMNDSSKNTENCVKKAGIKLAKIDKRTGKRVQFDSEYNQEAVNPDVRREHEYYDEDISIEVVED